MKKKHKIETIDDIKYCEEHCIDVYDDYQASVCFKFIDGVWCSYTNAHLNAYNVKLSLGCLYYYEEQEQPEVTKDDFGKLCWFWHDNIMFGESEKEAGILDHIEGKDYRTISGFIYSNCKRMTPSEVAEVTGYKVEEK